MGSFGGHILPGTCFLIFGTWFPIQKMIGTFHAKRNTGITVLLQLASIHNGILHEFIIKDNFLRTILINRVLLQTID